MLAQTRLGFIGAGRMATALIRGLLDAALVAPRQILVADVDAEKAQTLVSGHGVSACASNPELIRQADLVVLAVKPQHMVGVLDEIAPALRAAEQAFISIAAGVSLAKIQSHLGDEARVVRVMPNTPALIGAGVAGIAAGARATPDDVARTRAIFEAVGVAVVLDERDLDAVTAVSGSGPAYVFYFIESFIEAAIDAGLAPEVAALLVKRTVLGAARMANELTPAPAELRQAVTSRGGTTEAALRILREKGFQALLKRAVEAARERSIELGKMA